MAVTYADVPHLSPDCPWYSLSERFGVPNIKWCEASVCSVVVEPANTYSNLGYFIAAACAWHWTKRSSGTVKLLPWALVFLGACSAIYHASFTFVFQIVDFTGMFTVLGLLVGLNLARAQLLPLRAAPLLSAGSAVFGSALVIWMYSAQLMFQGLIALGVVAFLVSEAVARRRAHHSPPWTLFVLALLLLVAAQTVSVLDAQRIVCVPSSIIQGHAVWHLLSATSLALIAKYFATVDY